MKSYLLTFGKTLVLPKLSTSYIVEKRAKPLGKFRPLRKIILSPPEFKC